MAGDEKNVCYKSAWEAMNQKYSRFDVIVFLNSQDELSGDGAAIDMVRKDLDKYVQ